MKAKLLILTLAIALLTGCAGISIKKDTTTEVATDIAASTIGYYVGKNNPERIDHWNGWIDMLLEFGQGDTVLSFEELLGHGFDLVVGEPFLEMQLKKLIRLLEFPELQPPDLPFLTGDYVAMVKIVLTGFREGLMAAKAESDIGN
jgi:hypothetical protein